MNSQDKLADAQTFPLYEFTTLMMSSDPWPVSCVGHGDGRDSLIALANSEAQKLGFTDWLDAYHNLHSPAAPAQPPAPEPQGVVDREALGREVRRIWIEWAREQPNPKPSWFVPWDELAEPDREVDRRIGEQIAMAALQLPQTAPNDTRGADERIVRFVGIDPLNIGAGATHPMLRDSWRFAFIEDADGALRFSYSDNGPLVATDAVHPVAAVGYVTDAGVTFYSDANCTISRKPPAGTELFTHGIPITGSEGERG